MPHSHKRNDASTLGITLVFLSTFGFALQGVLVKLAYADGASMMAILLWRKLMFLPLFWIVALARLPRKKIFVKKSDIILSALSGGVGFFLVPMISMHALTMINAVIERPLMFTYPIMVIAISSVLERKWPSPLEVLVFFMIQAGTFFLIGGFGNRDLLGHNLVGAGEVLGNALIYAFFVILIQTLVRRIGSIYFTLWALTGATIIVAINSLINWQAAEFIITWRGALLIAMISLTSFPPALMFAEGVKRIGVSKASLVSSTAPLITALFAYLALDEVLLPGQIAGVLIIIMAILAMQKKALQLFIKTKGRPRKKAMPLASLPD